MKRETIKQMIMRNVANFPQFYTKIDDQILAVQIDTWEKLFSNADEEQVTDAFMKALNRAEYPVKPADINAILDAQKRATLPNCDELFDEACRVAQKINGYYSLERGWENEWGAEKTGYQRAMEIYNELPPILREWKNAPKALIDWYLGFGTENESFARKDFAHNIEERMRRREMLGIGWSEEFKPVIDGQTFKLIGGDK